MKAFTILFDIGKPLIAPFIAVATCGNLPQLCARPSWLVILRLMLISCKSGFGRMILLPRFQRAGS